MASLRSSGVSLKYFCKAALVKLMCMVHFLCRLGFKKNLLVVKPSEATLVE